MAVVACVTLDAVAQTLYLTTSKNYVSSNAAIGSLYVVDPTNASARLLAAIKVGGSQPVGINGIAVHPSTKVLYGITSAGAGLRPSLVTINPKTGEATVIGALGFAGTDLTFDRSGALYAWLSNVNQLGVVDLKTGVATPRGGAIVKGETIGGGMAIDSKGIALVASTTAAGTLDSVDTRTGAIAPGPVLSGAPYLSAIHSMTFSRFGTLYAINSNLGIPSKAALVTIGPATGVVTGLGALPDDAHGLAFSPDVVASEVDEAAGKRTAQIVAVVLGLGMVLSLWIWMRRRRGIPDLTNEGDDY